MANKLAKSGKSKMKGNTGRERERERDFFHLQNRFFSAKSCRGERKPAVLKG